MKKMTKRGPTMVKMKGIDPPKKFCPANIKKLSRAYESLNPALVFVTSLLNIFVSFYQNNNSYILDMPDS
jgi:hypothetical protein